jgi:hypothetical protein
MGRATVLFIFVGALLLIPTPHYLAFASFFYHIENCHLIIMRKIFHLERQAILVHSRQNKLIHYIN